MRAFVFTDETLKEQAGRFVWLAVDTEKAINASVQERYPIDAWPSLLVVDPKNERVVVRRVGGATVEQLQTILDEGIVPVEGSTPSEGPAAALERAERLYGERNFAEAARAYQEVLNLAPPGWPRYSNALESLLFSLTMNHECATTVRVAREALPKVKELPSALNVASAGLQCAIEETRTDPNRAASVMFFEKAARELIADPKAGGAADDRSSLYADLVRARKDAQDAAGAKQTAAEWARFLEGEANKAKTADARAVFDAQLLSAYLELGEPERAVPMLEASERDFPKDYNPPGRLALAYRRMKQWDAALAATDRALSRAYGPRKIWILVSRSDILMGRGDKAKARATLEEALKDAQSLPPGQRSESMVQSLTKRLASLQAAK